MADLGKKNIKVKRIEQDEDRVEKRAARSINFSSFSRRPISSKRDH